MSKEPSPEAMSNDIRVAEESLGASLIAKHSELRSKGSLNAATAPHHQNSGDDDSIFVDRNRDGASPRGAKAPTEGLLPSSRCVHTVNSNDPVDTPGCPEVPDKDGLRHHSAPVGIDFATIGAGGPINF